MFLLIILSKTLFGVKFLIDVSRNIVLTLFLGIANLIYPIFKNKNILLNPLHSIGNYNLLPFQK